MLLFSSPELILSCLLLFKWAMWPMDLLFYLPSFFLIYGHVQIKESAAGHHILFQTGNFNETSWLNLQYYEHLFCVICWCKMLKDQQYFCSLRVHTIMSMSWAKCLEHKLGKKDLEMQIDDAYSQSLSGIAEMEVDRFER